MAREVKFLKEQLDNPKRPYVVVLGGAKIADKLELVHKLLAKADRIVIGGGMAFTFLKAQGKNVGRSLVDESLIEEAGKILEAAKSQGVEIFLPRDVVAADQISKDAAWRVVALSDLRPDEMGVDIGPETCTEFGMALAGAKTILWNGPMGVFEYAPFQTGTQLVIDTIIEATSQGAISVVGGGDSASAIDKLSKAKYFTHISTGGGASLELVGGHTLPALEALS